MPSAQKNHHAQVAYFRVTCPELLQSSPGLQNKIQVKGLYLGSGGHTSGEVKPGRKGGSKVCVGKHRPQNDPTQEARELGYLYTTVPGARALTHRDTDTTDESCSGTVKCPRGITGHGQHWLQSLMMQFV